MVRPPPKKRPRRKIVRSEGVSVAENLETAVLNCQLVLRPFLDCLSLHRLLILRRVSRRWKAAVDLHISNLTEVNVREVLITAWHDRERVLPFIDWICHINGKLHQIDGFFDQPFHDSKDLPKYLPHMSNLTQLDLSDFSCRVKNETVKYMFAILISLGPQLEYLGLGKLKFWAKGKYTLEQFYILFENMPNIKKMYIENAEWDHPVQFCTRVLLRLPRPEKMISLSVCELSKETWEYLDRLPNLEEFKTVSIRHDSFFNMTKTIRVLGNLSHLRVLQLRGNQKTRCSQLEQIFEGLPNLESVSVKVFAGRFTETGWAMLNSLTKLHSLDLNERNVYELVDQELLGFVSSNSLRKLGIRTTYGDKIVSGRGEFKDYLGFLKEATPNLENLILDTTGFLVHWKNFRPQIECNLNLKHLTIRGCGGMVFGMPEGRVTESVTLEGTESFVTSFDIDVIHSWREIKSLKLGLPDFPVAMMEKFGSVCRNLKVLKLILCCFGKTRKSAKGLKRFFELADSLEEVYATDFNAINFKMAKIMKPGVTLHIIQ